MILFRGTGVSPDIVSGKLIFYERELFSFQKQQVDEPATEVKRYLRAKEQTLLQVQALFELAKREVSPENAAIGCPSWDLMTTTLDLPKSFLYRFKTLARAALSVIPFPPLLLTSSNEKSTSGSSPFCTNTQVSPQLSISFPSMVMVITEDRS